MKKGPESWTVAMEGEHGIVSSQEILLNYLSEVPVTIVREAKEYLSNKIEVLTAQSEQSEFPLSSIKADITSQYYRLSLPQLGVAQFIVAVKKGESDAAKSCLQDLLTTAAALSSVSVYAYDYTYDQHHMFGMSSEQKAAFRILDITKPSSVVLDNYDTLLNVFRVAVQDIETHSAQIIQLRSLLEPDIYDGLKMSHLEQCARAPFGFWALTRKIVPTNCGGERIVNFGQGFGRSFLQALKTEKVLSPIEPNIRHGGCPALYPAFRGSSQINRFGKLFIDLHEKLHTN